MEATKYIHRFNPAIDAHEEAERVYQLLDANITDRLGLERTQFSGHRVIIPPSLRKYRAAIARKYGDALNIRSELTLEEYLRLYKFTEHWVNSIYTHAVDNFDQVPLRVTTDTRKKRHIVIETDRFTPEQIVALLTA